MKRTIFTFVFAIYSSAALAQWAPPIGVPKPSIGIDPIATTSITISSAPWTQNCPADKPCLVGGGTYGWLDIRGSYLIIEKAKMAGCSIAAGAHHIVIRDSEIVGDKSGGGCTIGNGDAGAANTVVLLRNKIHDIGDVNATTDQDAHCIGIGYESSYIWILDNQFWRCGGDAVQVNGGQGRPNWRNLHHIYIGRNTAIHNRQTGFWVKNSADVVLSENVVTRIRAGRGGEDPGVCLGGQYGSDRLVIIGNRVSDCPYGIALMSDGDFGKGVLLYGNVVFNTIHDPLHKPEDIRSAYSDNVAFLLAGGQTRVMLHNTMVDIGGGIQIPASGGTVAGANNVIVRAKRHIALEGSTNLNILTTLFGEGPTLYQAQTTGQIIGQPVFVGGSDYTIASGPGKGKAIAINPNDAYKAISGGNSYREMHLVDLPMPGLDVGAFGSVLLPHLLTEPGVGPLPPPLPPTPPVDTRPLCSSLTGWTWLRAILSNPRTCR
jgi:hypothetical protein